MHASVVGLLLTACGSGEGRAQEDSPVDSGGPGVEATSPTADANGARTDANGDEGFEPFFDGQTLDGFELVGITASDVTIEDGALKCSCVPNGYLYRNETFRNFILRVSFRFERPAGLASGADDTFTGNSGYFVYLTPPHEVWPRCLEVQGSYLETGDIFGLPGLLEANDAPDFASIVAARRPVGEWNDLVVTSEEGALTVELNGVPVNTSPAGELREGLIALESEGAEVHWRDVMIKRL